jgi:hypothetical protein
LFDEDDDDDDAIDEDAIDDNQPWRHKVLESSTGTLRHIHMVRQNRLFWYGSLVARNRPLRKK